MQLGDTDRLRTALVTGANGFVGPHLVERLLASKWQVLTTCRGIPSEGAIPFDLRGPELPKLPDGIDAVFHLAGKAHALSDNGSDGEYEHLNTGGTWRLLEASKAAGVRAFVYFSSIKAAEYPLGHQEADETCNEDPLTPYGRSKRKAEDLVINGGFVPHPVVLRPCLVYGCKPKGNLAAMIRGVSSGRFPPLPEFHNRRSMIGVEDLAAAAEIAAIESAAKAKTYIVADDGPFSTRQLYEAICAACGKKVPSWSVPVIGLRGLAYAGDLFHAVVGRRCLFDSDRFEKLAGWSWYSSAKLKRELGWKPTVNLFDRLNDIVASCIS